MTFTESLKYAILLVLCVIYLIQFSWIFDAFANPEVRTVTKSQVVIMLIPFGWLYFMYKWFKGLK
jgi:hypothetical protein